MTKKIDSVSTEKSNSDKIWEHIKNMNINMFALPAQKVSDYCTPVQVEPTKLYVTLRVPAALPVLEEMLGKKYVFVRHDKWITIEDRPTE